MMVCNGLFFTAQLVCVKLLKNMQWPFFRMMAVSTTTVSLCVVAWCCAARLPLPLARTQKWILLRGVFAVLNFVLQVMAVRVGASAGDVASLNSVSSVFAALLGFAFLGEQLLFLHGIALCCCMSGAVLVAQPEFLFGQGDGPGTPWEGHVLAVVGGAMQAGLAICSRKSGEASPMWGTLSTTTWSSIAFFVLPCTPLVEDYVLEPLWAKPVTATLWVAVLVVCLFASISSSSAGSQWCPAAVSTTVGTASRMIWGYLAHLLIFRSDVQPLTVVGAAMMLGGVVVMALARAKPPAALPPPVAGQAGFNDVLSGDATPASMEDETESLASFIAEEFAILSPHESPAVRLRRGPTVVDSMQSAAQVAAERIGVAG